MAFFESFNRDFQADKLAFPLETGCLVPALSPYLKRDGFTAGDKKVDVIAYKKICEVLIENFESRYGYDFTLLEKTTWKADAKAKWASMTRPLRRPVRSCNKAFQPGQQLSLPRLT